MPSNSARSAHTSADVHQPAGPIVRIRAPWPGDAQAVQSVLALPEAPRIGAARGEEAGERGTFVADLPWGGRIIDHAAGRRLSGPRATVQLTLSRSFARRPRASDLLVRPAHVDSALIPTLVITGTDGGEDFEHVLTAALGAARRPDESFELATHEWPTALASFEHGSDPVLGAEDPRPAIAPQISPRTPDGRVVIVGGGVAALECLMALRDLGGPIFGSGSWPPTTPSPTGRFRSSSRSRSAPPSATHSSASSKTSAPSS